MARVVVACINAAGKGSVAAAARWQAAVLGTRHDVYLVSDSEPDNIRNVSTIGVRKPDLRWLRRLAHVPSEAVLSLRVQRAIAGLHAERPLDVVFYHNHSLLGVRVPGVLENVPKIMTTHADIFDQPQGSYDSRVVAFYKCTARRAYSHASVVTANSAYTCERVNKVSSGTRIEMLHVPVELSDIDESTGSRNLPRECRGNGCSRILFVGRLAHEKGFDVLLDAHRHLVERGVPVELFVVGDGPLSGEIEKAERLAGPGARIHRSGWQPRSGLASVYRSADVLCVPSRRESLGLVAIEALLCGLPVAAADTGGLREVVRHGIDGELVPPEDPAALADSIARILAEPGYRERMPDHEWLDRFSPEQVSRQLWSLVDQLVA